MAALVRSAKEAAEENRNTRAASTGILCLSANTRTNSSPADFHEIPPASKWTCEVNVPDKFQSMNEAAHTLIPSNFSHFPGEILVCECVQGYVQLIL